MLAVMPCTLSTHGFPSLLASRLASASPSTASRPKLSVNTSTAGSAASSLAPVTPRLAQPPTSSPTQPNTQANASLRSSTADTTRDSALDTPRAPTAAKKVSFRPGGPETIHTSTYTRAHVELLDEDDRAPREGRREERWKAAVERAKADTSDDGATK